MLSAALVRNCACVWMWVWVGRGISGREEEASKGPSMQFASYFIPTSDVLMRGGNPANHTINAEPAGCRYTVNFLYRAIYWFSRCPHTRVTNSEGRDRCRSDVVDALHQTLLVLLFSGLFSSVHVLVQAHQTFTKSKEFDYTVIPRAHVLARQKKCVLDSCISKKKIWLLAVSTTRFYALNRKNACAFSHLVWDTCFRFRPSRSRCSLLYARSAKGSNLFFHCDGNMSPLPPSFCMPRRYAATSSLLQFKLLLRLFCSACCSLACNFLVIS